MPVFSKVLVSGALSVAAIGLTTEQGQGPKVPANTQPLSTAVRKTFIRGAEGRMAIPNAANGNVKLYREGSGGENSMGSTATATATLRAPAATFGALVAPGGQIKFTLPMTLRAGRYLLQLEPYESGPKSALYPILVTEPKMMVNDVDNLAGVGGEVMLWMNYCAPDARVVFTRKWAAEPPVFWWAPVRSNPLTTAAVQPEIKRKDDGTDVVTAKAPKGLGGGIYSVSVRRGNENVKGEDVLLTYGLLPMPSYSLRYEGIDCLIDTNEIGDDEVYPIFVTARSVGKYDQAAKKWYAQPWTNPFANVGPNVMGLDKGESRNAPALLMSGHEVPMVDFGLAVILMERDDDQNGDRKYYDSKLNQYLNSPSGPEHLASRAKGAFTNAQHEYDYLDDDLIGIANLSLTEAKKKALASGTWHPAAVTITGDGGKYRLRFSVRCDPWKTGPMQPFGPQEPFTGFPPP